MSDAAVEMICTTVLLIFFWAAFFGNPFAKD